MRRTIRILCVDDHAFVVDGLQARFAREQDIECAGRLDSANDLLAQAMTLKPDVVLMDIEMPGADPFEAAADVGRICPATRVAILSAHVRDRYLSAAFNAGCWGYFSKADDPDAIIEGIRRLRNGEFVLSPRVAERCEMPARRGRSERPSPQTARTKLELLTDREEEVLRMIGRGMTRTEIAMALHRSPKTIDGHRERILAKLGLQGRVELVRFAIREGLAEAE